MPRPKWRDGHWRYWFFEETYRENIHLIWPVNEEQRRLYVKHYFDIDSQCSDRWSGRVSEVLADPSQRFGGAQVLSLREWNADSADYSILSHEVFHVAANILSSRGIDFDNRTSATNEAYAYLIQRLTYTCHRALTMTLLHKPHKRRRK